MIEDLDLLATEWFRTFARFEYALKAAGFHNGHGTAEPNWRSFAESVAGFFDDPQNEILSEAVRYIRDHPPKKQIIADGNLDWHDAAPNTTCSPT